VFSSGALFFAQDDSSSLILARVQEALFRVRGASYIYLPDSWFAHLLLRRAPEVCKTFLAFVAIRLPLPFVAGESNTAWEQLRAPYLRVSLFEYPP
jgi:hypothetical protein